jgi:hypothetical protein
MKAFASETFEQRVVRLMGKELRSPEKTRELLERLSHAARETPQPSNGGPELGGHQLFDL